MEEIKILCCIFSWKGQYENAIKLQEQLSNILTNVIVINSDDDNTKDGWIDIGNECYFSDQFKTALNLFDDTKYDALWHIQADASYDDWSSILTSAIESFDIYNWGVFAPNVNDTYYISEKTDISTLSGNLKLVATPDNTCWIVHKDYINMMKDNLDLMDNNILGWGWDLLICAFSHIDNRYVIRDYSFEIKHPTSTGYMKDQAEKEMQDMFHKCSTKLQETIYKIKISPKDLCEYHNIQKVDAELIYNTATGTYR